MAILTSANLSRQLAFAWPTGALAPKDVPGVNATMPQLINALNNSQSNAIQAIQERHMGGLAAQLPPPGIVGRLYFATDTGVLFYDTGTAWQAVVPQQTSSTWTPTFTTTGTTGAITYTSQVGNQIKTGNIIQQTFVLAWSAFSGWNGDMFVSGFPTATLNLAGAVYAGSIAQAHGINTNLAINIFIPANGTTLNITLTNAGLATNLNSAQFANTGVFSGSIIYPIA